MAWTLRLLGVESIPDEEVQRTCPGWEPGGWLAEYDPDVGLESVVTTNLQTEAQQFESAKAAGDFWQTVDPHDPVRPDGLPNRPLTAFTVEISQYGAEINTAHLDGLLRRQEDGTD